MEKIKNNSNIFKVNKNIFTEEEFAADCPGYSFVPTILPDVKRIIVIGDIHGDLSLAIRSFQLAKLIDDDFNWIAEPANTVVVQIGDQIDSCRPIPGVFDCHNTLQSGDKNEDMKVINFFNSMDELAREHGGAVYSLFGNHELMNVQSNFSYVSYKNFHDFNYEDSEKEYSGPEGRKEVFKPGGSVAKMLACSRLSVLIIGNNLFVHAGILPILAQKLDHLNLDPKSKLKYLNIIVRKWLLKKLSEDQKEDQKVLVNDNTLSPFWVRLYGSIPEGTKLESPECEESVGQTLKIFKIGHIIVGHTPQLFTNKDGINGTCYEIDGDNKLYRVDGGFSRAFNIFGNNQLVQILEIVDGDKFNIITDRRKYVTPPDIDISEKYLDKVAAIYAQNRPTISRKSSKKLHKQKFY